MESARSAVTRRMARNLGVAMVAGVTERRGVEEEEERWEREIGSRRRKDAVVTWALNGAFGGFEAAGVACVSSSRPPA